MKELERPGRHLRREDYTIKTEEDGSRSEAPDVE